MRISDWSSDVCSSDLHRTLGGFHADALAGQGTCAVGLLVGVVGLVVTQPHERAHDVVGGAEVVLAAERVRLPVDAGGLVAAGGDAVTRLRSEEHTSELQSLMRISYAAFCLKKTTH